MIGDTRDVQDLQDGDYEHLQDGGGHWQDSDIEPVLWILSDSAHLRIF